MVCGGFLEVPIRTISKKRVTSKIAKITHDEYKLIIELDWSIHNLEEAYILDREKEKLLIKNWYKILRFENGEVLSSLNEVLGKIKEEFL